MKYKAFNNSIGSPHGLSEKKLTAKEERDILAGLFEQLLLFDKITIRVSGSGYQLNFLLKHLGINKVEELIEKKLIEFMVWTPSLLAVSGKNREDGTVDISAINGMPPLIAASSFGSEQTNPEHIIKKALNLVPD